MSFFLEVRSSFFFFDGFSKMFVVIELVYGYYLFIVLVYKLVFRVLVVLRNKFVVRSSKFWF